MENIEYDICVIGTGIGGGTIIDNLCKKNSNLRIAIVEAGDETHRKNSFYDSIGLDFKLLSTSIQVGGTSNLWHGVLGELDEIDFTKRSWIPKSGWPINLEDLKPYYEKAANYLGVEKFEYFSIDELNNELKRDINSMKINSSYFQNKLFQQPIKVHNFKDTIRDNIKKYKNIEFFKLSEALAFEGDKESKKIEKLIYLSSSNETKFIKSKFFILCAGALESPRILLNSSKIIDNKNIGRYLMDHPIGNLMQMEFNDIQRTSIYSDIKYSKRMKIKTGITLNDEVQQKFELPNHNFFLRPSFVKGVDDESEKLKLKLLTFKSGNLKIADLLELIKKWNVIRQILIYKFGLNVKYKYADLFFVTEQIPNWNSYVALSKKNKRGGYPIAEVNWQLTDYDKESMKKIFHLIQDSLFPNNIVNYTHTINEFNWEKIFTSGAHHVGTLRMSENQIDGVVDKNLKVHDIDNLFVCDGSIFPTSGNVNIGLTISAFGIRLADYLTLNKLK